MGRRAEREGPLAFLGPEWLADRLVLQDVPQTHLAARTDERASARRIEDGIARGGRGPQGPLLGHEPPAHRLAGARVPQATAPGLGGVFVRVSPGDRARGMEPYGRRDAIAERRPPVRS